MIIQINQMVQVKLFLLLHEILQRKEFQHNCCCSFQLLFVLPKILEGSHCFGDAFCQNYQVNLLLQVLCFHEVLNCNYGLLFLNKVLKKCSSNISETNMPNKMKIYLFKMYKFTVNFHHMTHYSIYQWWPLIGEQPTTPEIA